MEHRVGSVLPSWPEARGPGWPRLGSTEGQLMPRLIAVLPRVILMVATLLLASPPSLDAQEATPGAGQATGQAATPATAPPCFAAPSSQGNE